MFQISIDQYYIKCQSNGLPTIYPDYKQYAKLAEEFDLANPEGNISFVSVGIPGKWPFLVVACRCDPGEFSGFHPGALIIPETNVLFLGCGERILAYDLAQPARLWEDMAGIGFWEWQRYGDYVVMAAELELAAWDIHAKKLWTTYVEPPWDYSVEDGYINLDVMGNKSRFLLSDGPS
jgi:hypothetical protein